MPDEPPKKQIQLKQTSVISGPLPPPEALARYDAIKPGFAERIMKMAEEEAIHRRIQEGKALAADVEVMRAYPTEVRLGQIFAFLIGLAALGLGAYTAVSGAEVAGGFIGTTGVVGLVSAFILGRYTPKNLNQP